MIVRQSEQAIRLRDVLIPVLKKRYKDVVSRVEDKEARGGSRIKPEVPSCLYMMR